MNLKRLSVFFDRDRHANFENALKLCKKNRFLSVVSNPCFELWLFLHFNSRVAAFGGPEEVFKRLKKISVFARYNKDGKKAFSTTVSLHKVAILNAKSLARSQKQLHQDPSTNMHDLIERLQILKSKQAI